METQHQLTVGILWRDKGPVPQIRLSGHWLKECGFTPGEKIRVTVGPEGLTVRPVEENKGQNRDKSGCNGWDG